MTYPRLILQRRPFEEGQPTRGSFLWESAAGVMRHLMVRSLELPWHNNAPRISCIPAGAYPMKWTFSPTFNRMMWLVEDVPGRTGIRIHSGNYAGDKVSDSLGCILPCVQWADINGDGVLDGTASKVATATLEQHLSKYQDSGITLVVVDGVPSVPKPTT